MDLHQFIASAETAGYLITVDREVDPYLEAARLAAEVDGRPILFRRVKGSPFPVVAGVCSDRRYFGMALGVPADQVMFRLAEALAAALTPAPLPTLGEGSRTPSSLGRGSQSPPELGGREGALPGSRRAGCQPGGHPLPDPLRGRRRRICFGSGRLHQRPGDRTERILPPAAAPRPDPCRRAAGGAPWHGDRLAQERTGRSARRHLHRAAAARAAGRVHGAAARRGRNEHRPGAGADPAGDLRQRHPRARRGRVRAGRSHHA